MTDKTPLAVPFDLIPPKPVHWLHEGFVPFRHVTVVLGPGGTSKGITVLDYGARMTRWAPMPGETVPSYDGPRDFILVAPEDDANESVAWRLLGAEAVPDRVHNMTILPGERWFSLQSDLPDLGKGIDQIERAPDGTTRLAADGLPHRVGMIILDPLLALSETDLRTRGQARPVMEQLELLARKRGLVILLTHHTNANGQAASSRAIIETARNVLTLDRPPKADPDSPLRVVTVAKTNIGLTGAQLHYSLAGTAQQPRLEWAADVPAEDAAAAGRGYEIHAPVPMAPVPVAVAPVAAVAAKKLACVHPWKPGSCADCPLKAPEAELAPKAAKPVPAIVDRRRWRRPAA